MALKDMEQSHLEFDSQRCCVGHWLDFDSETAELQLNPGSFAAGWAGSGNLKLYIYILLWNNDHILYTVAYVKIYV